MKDIELGLKSPDEKLSFYSVSCSQLKKVKVSDLVVLWLSSRVKKFRIFRRIFELTREKRSQRSQYGSSSKAKCFSRDGFSLQAGKRQMALNGHSRQDPSALFVIRLWKLSLCQALR